MLFLKFPPGPLISCQKFHVVASDYSFLFFSCAPLKRIWLHLLCSPVPLKDYRIAVNLLTFSRRNQTRPLHHPLCILFSTSLSIWGDPDGLPPVQDVATPVSSRWENKRSSPDLLAALLLMQLNMQPAFIPSTHALLGSPSGSPGPLRQRTQPVSPLPVKMHGALALKCGLAFLCAEHLEIFADSFVQKIRSPLSSSPALLLSSGPLNLMSSENAEAAFSSIFQAHL